MNKELVVRSTSSGVEIALLENKSLVELHQESSSNNFVVGDLFLARVKKVIPSLNAAFMDVGFQKDAFLHYTDLGPNIRSLNKYTNLAIDGRISPNLAKWRYEPEIVKTGKINEVLREKQYMLVQILKEPISSKGPRLSSEINLAGRYLVLSPFTNVISVSKKISTNEERKRLQRLIESIKPKNFGVIVRTAAEGKKVSELHEDLQHLVDKWKEVNKNLKGSRPPLKILSELNRTTSILRDLLTSSFNNIIVNDQELFGDIKDYVTKIAPEQRKIVSIHRSRKPIFDSYGITKQIKSSFGDTVSMPSGAYLVIEHTEAAHIIDVNSGHKVSRDESQEDTAVKVNLEAAEEISRQLRLRDLGGIIIIDYIDMKVPGNKKKIYEAMKEHMKNDRAKHTILPLSKFCLLQITRQRSRPEINIATSEKCPSCNGTGKVTATILLIDEIENNLTYLIEEQKEGTVKLFVHPFIEAFLKKGFRSPQRNWFLKFHKWIKIFPDSDFDMTEYRFFNADGEEISNK